MSGKDAESGDTQSEAEAASRSLLLCLSRAELTVDVQERAQRLLDKPVDWPLFIEWAGLHQVAPLIAHNLFATGLDCGVPLNAWKLLQQALQAARFDVMLQFQQVARVLDALQAAGIDFVLLKGYGLADLLYGDLALRPSADLDLLVPVDQIEPACAALASVGIALPPAEVLRFHMRNGYHLPLAGVELAGRDLAVELHWDLGPRGLTPLKLAQLWARSQRFTVDGLTARRFSPEDMLLHLVLHIRKHRFVGLRWLCDIADLVRRFDTQLDWTYVVENAGVAGLRTLLFTSLSASVQWLEAPVPPTVLAGLQPSSFRRHVVAATLPRDPLDVPIAADKAGWTRLAPAEVLLLDKPSAMARELRYRLFPPAEKLTDAASGENSGAQRLSLYASRLAQRTATLLRRSP